MDEQQFWDAVEGLLEAISDAYRDVQRGNEELPGLFNEAVIPTFLRALEASGDDARAAATWTLGILRELILAGGTARAVPDLLDGLQHQDSGIRRASARALGWLGNEAAVPGLNRALGDQDASVRREAAEALGKIVSRHPIADQTLPELVRLLKDEVAEVRYAAVWALGHSGDVAVVPELAKLLKDPERDVRRVVARSLGWLEDKAALIPLIEALHDPSGGVRRDTAGALGKIGDRAATPALLDALDDEREAVRYAAAWALGQIGDETALSGLLHTLSDDNDDVRRAAAEALGKIGDERVIPALHKALREAQAAGKDAQVYAIGVVLYEKLTASMPVEAYEFGPRTSRALDPVTEVQVPMERMAARSGLSTNEMVRYIETLIDQQLAISPEGAVDVSGSRGVIPTVEQESPAAGGGKPKDDTARGDQFATGMFTLAPPSGQPIKIMQASVIIGRSKQGGDNDPDLDLMSLGVPDARTASRRHCRIFRRGHEYFVEDLGSMNGTRVNGQKLEPGQAHPLNDSDQIAIGRVLLVFKRA